MGSLWQTTCSALRDSREPDWEEVEDYREPIRLLLRARYARGFVDDPEDLMQEILIAIRCQLFQRYDAQRGRFRDFLRGVVHNKVLKRWRRAQRLRPMAHVGELPEVTDQDTCTVDLVAELLAALRRWHDQQLDRGDAGLRAIHVLAGRLLHGRSYQQIAEREELSRASIKRSLTASRDAIVGDLLRHTLEVPEEAKAGIDWSRLGRAAREALKNPGRQRDVLASLGQPAMLKALQLWLDVYTEALLGFVGGAADSAALQGELALILA